MICFGCDTTLNAGLIDKEGLGLFFIEMSMTGSGVIFI